MKWVVKDSDGSHHIVEAEYIAQPANGGYTNFITKDATPNMGMTESFFQPISVTTLTRSQERAHNLKRPYWWNY